MDRQRLQMGAILLPHLIEFYQWLHTHIAHLITYERASSVTIGYIVRQAVKNSNKEYGQHILELYEQVKRHYNIYVELIGGAIGAEACAAVRQGSKIFTIADDIPVLHFLSGTVSYKKNDLHNFLDIHFMNVF